MKHHAFTDIFLFRHAIADNKNGSSTASGIESANKNLATNENAQTEKDDPQEQSSQSHPSNSNIKNENTSGLVNNAHQVASKKSLPHQPSCDSDQSVPEDRLAELKSFPYYQLYIHLKQGHDLPAKDACGTSDPYVKFSWKGKPVYKSKIIYKDLNPFWDEAFILTIDDPLQSLEMKVGL